MSTWEQTLAFGFLTDVDRREAPPPDFAWCPRNINISLKPNTDPLSVATACICAVYSKCEGDDAVLVVDGKPPSAVLNPFSTLKETPFVDIIAAVDESRKKVDPQAVELRKTLSTQLKQRADSNSAATGGNALVGTGGILWRSTITSIGELAAVHAFDMVWSVSQPDDAVISIGILYNASLFSPVTMEDRLELLELIATAYSANESIVLRRDVETLTPSMRHRLLCEWQPERVPFHVYSRTLPDLFIESVRERCGDPNEKLAVMEPSTGRTITYTDMLIRARKLAQFLRAKVPCDKWGVDATCGIHVPRCLDWYVMMLGLHLAGGAYLSLDPDFPADRLLYTLEDSGAVCLLTLRRMMGSLGYQGPTFAIDELWDEIDAIEIDEHFIAPSTAESPAYLIYTSGSTGKPKGVCIEHRNAVNFVESERRLFNIDNNHRVIQGFSTSFDASVEEIWLAFASGSTLIVVDKAVMQDVELLGKLVSATKATILSTVPTLLATIDSRQLASLEMVIAGGEACNKEVIRAYATGGKRKFVNSYGPTEATVACMADFSSPDRPVTIGRPQPGYFACIVNERMELVPPGVPGELCMAGPSVARGYVNRPDLTAEKFCPCPYFSIPKSHFNYDDATANDPTFGRLYHTGDLTRWNKDGRVEFLGRIDSQVKLRGFRIEVGEIETNLAAFPGVRTAVVHLVNDNGHQYLCGYMLCEPELKANFVEHAFKDFLKDKLPAYMIPSRFTTIEVVPRSPAGKLDRKQLPLPPPVAAAAGSDEEEKVAPASVTEKLVHSMWSEMFPGMRIGTTEDFFEIGGHSLLAGKLASKIRQQGYQEFSIRLVYANPTIQQLAAVMDSMPRTSQAEAQGTQVSVKMPDRFEPGMTRKVLFALWQIAVFTIAIGLQWAYLLTFFFIFYGRQHQEIAAWVPGRGVRYILFFGSVMQLFFVVFNIILGFIVIPLLKWIIIGRVRPGQHSIWSFYYLRWWTARAFNAQAGSFLMFGTYFYNLQLIIFGASLGASGTITTFIQDPDLVEIGDDCQIGDNALLVTSQVIDSMLMLKKVTIGNCCTVCARSTICGGAQLEDEVFITPLTLIREGTIVPRGERWAGSPGQKVGYVVQLSQMRDVGFDGETLKGEGLSPHASGINEDGELDEELLAGQAFRNPAFIRFLIGILQLAFYVVVLMFTSNVLGILTFGAWALCDELANRGELWWVSLYAVGAPIVTGIIMLYQHLFLIIFRWIVFPWKPREGMYPCDSLMFHRKILFDMVARVSLLYAHPMYGSIYTQYFLKAMGCKVGKRVECSNLYGWTPGLTTFGDECFVADFVGVNSPEIFRGVLKLSAVTIGNRAFIGNGSVLPPGTVIGDKALLGLTSCPAGLIVGAGKTAIGSPAFEIPRRTSADTVDQNKTFEPTTLLVIRRCVWETFRCVMPATFVTFSAILAFVCAAAIFYDNHTVIIDEPGKDKRPIYVALAFLFVWAIPLFNLIFVLLSKWTIVGTHDKEENPLWSAGVWRSEFVVDVTTVVGNSGTINLFRGTLFMPWLFRLLGARIGKNCFIDTLYLTEPDMLTIGDGVCINYNATIQTHLFEDRVMKMDTMAIGHRASVGPFSIVLYNTVLGSGSTVGPLTLVMKGESLPKHTHWSGIPAQKCAAPTVLQEGSNIQVVVPTAEQQPPVQTSSAIASGRLASQRSLATTPVVSARERQGFTRVADWLSA